MKKTVSVVLVLLFVLIGSYSLALPLTAEEPVIPNGLVVAFDFEGDNFDVQLADKAPEGTVRDNLSVAGSVHIRDGLAMVNSAAGSQLKFNTTADLQGLKGYTVYVKMKAAGEYGEKWVNPVQANGLFRMIINGKTDSGFSLQARAKADFATQHPIPESGGLKDGEWFYVAYTAYLEDGKLKTATYYSKNGTAYVTAEKEYEVSYTSMGVSNFTLIGQKQDGSIEMTFDDVLFFNRALRADEIQTLSGLKLPQPAAATEKTTEEEVPSSAPATTETKPAPVASESQNAPESTVSGTDFAKPTDEKGCRSAIGSRTVFGFLAVSCAVVGIRKKVRSR